jgi:hypothetical protein
VVKSAGGLAGDRNCLWGITASFDVKLFNYSGGIGYGRLFRHRRAAHVIAIALEEVTSPRFE